jgi:hypothetical protein
MTTLVSAFLMLQVDIRASPPHLVGWAITSDANLTTNLSKHFWLKALELQNTSFEDAKLAIEGLITSPIATTGYEWVGKLPRLF